MWTVRKLRAVGASIASRSGAVGLVAVAFLFAGSALAGTAELDLRTSANVEIVGAFPHNLAGFSERAAGDVNGDGIGDVVIGAPGSSFNGRSRSGSVYVVFGARDRGRATARVAVGARGFRIDGAQPDDMAGFSVSSAGDVNGDGLDDLVIGAPGWRPRFDKRLPEVGAVYVVFGKRDGATVDLAHLGSAGFRVEGGPGGDLGESVDGGVTSTATGSRTSSPGRHFRPSAATTRRAAPT